MEAIFDKVRIGALISDPVVFLGAYPVEILIGYQHFN